jgi:N-acetylmuramic acid 6-phosphate (MurNAc-6-P) etherase
VAEKALEDSGFKVKIAILMILLNIDAPTAKSRLESSSDRIREALHE